MKYFVMLIGIILGSPISAQFTQVTSPGLVVEQEDNDGYFAKFGKAGTFFNPTSNLRIGSNKIQTVRTGVFTFPPTFPALLLNPQGGNVGIGTDNPTGRLSIFHNSSHDSPSLVITEEGQDAGRLQFRNSAANYNRYYEISASPGAPGDLVRNFAMRYFDGSTTNTFFHFSPFNNTLSINTSQEGITYINKGTNSELRVGTVQGGQDVNIRDAIRIYGDNEQTFWDIKSTDRLTFGQKNEVGNIGDRAYIDSDGDYHQISDRRLKENIQPLKNCLSTLLQLKPSTYHFITDKEQETKSLGFIAQEVEEIFPEAVNYNKDMDQYTLAYKNISVLAVGAIQEQEQEIAHLNKDQDELSKQIELLARRLRELMKQ